MNKTTKGAIAAALGAVLLVGGASTIAFWTDSADIDGGTITAGELSLAPGTAGTWTDTTTGVLIDPTAFLVVPGDTLVYEADFVVTAIGDNLSATLDVDDSSITGDPELIAESDITVAVLDAAGVPLPTITEANNGATITAQVTFDFPFDPATNDSQTDSVDLSGLVLDLVQTDV